MHVYQLFSGAVGGVDSPPSDFFTMAAGPTRGHPFKLKKPAAASRRRCLFAVHVMNDWNGLPADVVCAPSLNTIKPRLDAHLAHLRFSIPGTD